LAVVAYGAYLFVTLTGTRSDLNTARRDLNEVRSGFTVEKALTGDLRPLDDAVLRLKSANSRLSSPFLVPLRPLPFVGRQLASARAIVRTAANLAEPSVVGLHEVQAVPSDAPLGVRARAMAAAGTATIEKLQTRLKAVDLGPSEGLLGPLADARNELIDGINRIQPKLPDATTGLQAVTEVMTGNHKYLILAGNNAEMGAGAVVPLTSGILEVNDGKLSVGSWVWLDSPTIQHINVGAGSGPLGELWSFVQPGRDLHEMTQSPSFPLAAPLAVSVYESWSKTKVDGVILVDAEALMKLANRIGPTTLGGKELSGEALRTYIFHDQYLQLGDSLEAEDSFARHDAVLDLSERTMQRIVSDPGSLPNLTKDLLDLAHDRHLMVWSSNTNVQASAHTMRADGSLPDDAALVAINNRGGNKLDWFSQFTMNAVRTPGPERDAIWVDVELRSWAPAGNEPRYVIGPNGEASERAGQIVGYLSVVAPRGATEMNFEGDGQLVVNGTDDGHPVLSRLVRVDAGGTWRGVWSFSVPHGAKIVPAPSARPIPSIWNETVA
jgi:Protein of unknown function (DUF4012)